ncbi:unnamed protein product [Candidula unifasciata]|uniref:Protein quiver n=1 Tax=Candidula unifasciata TaxID=100452 RepID=A0A8S3YII3_9EUPU|nr:unnamed protein product [Candidula unifasciata]
MSLRQQWVQFRSQTWDYCINRDIIELSYTQFTVLSVSGLTCVQCMSMNTPSCLHGRLTPTPCIESEHKSKYCYKSVGTQTSGNGHFVSRGCSMTLQKNCTTKLVLGDFYNVCHDSCDHDGCNRALALSSVGINLLFLAFIVITADLLAADVFRLRLL